LSPFFKPVRDGEKVRFRGELCRFFQQPLGPPAGLWSFWRLSGAFFNFVLLGWIITAFMGAIVGILTLWVSVRIREQEALAESENRFKRLLNPPGSA